MLIAPGTMLFDPLETGLKEDCPYGDITTELLDIHRQGTFKFISRTAAIVSGTPQLAEFFAAKKLQVTCMRRPWIAPAASRGNKRF